ADRSWASVAAASVLAKCERDALMVRHAAAHPAYRWDENKGYAAPEHLAALREHGPTPLHRRSWRLPAVQERPVEASGPGWHAEPLLADGDPAASS
ncbi:ribonuclease HII, partial [Streptomyces sp. SID12501]|nr:ribonuclease HII [Streptomyces sp. SID12501]